MKSLSLFGGIVGAMFLYMRVKKRTTRPDDRIDQLRADTLMISKSVVHAYTGPVRWQAPQWLQVGGIALAVYSLHRLDERLNARITPYNDHVPDAIQDAAFYLGKPLNSYAIMAAIYTTGWLSEHQRTRETGMLLLTAATVAGLLQTVSKTVVGRARPRALVGSRTFRVFATHPDYYSFPSGHTVMTVIMAHALAKSTNERPLKSLIYLLGAITPASRLWTNAHWPSDVALGTILGVAAVDSVRNSFNRL